MVFHHRDPNTKEFKISAAILNWEKIRQEIDKCELLCCRCHTELHYGAIEELGNSPR